MRSGCPEESFYADDFSFKHLNGKLVACKGALEP